ncbi:MAG: RluA family pseudouridine synthase [Pseudomonadota bacterium]
MTQINATSDGPDIAEQASDTADDDSDQAAAATSPAAKPTKGPRIEAMGVAADDDGLRLDRWFKQHFPDITHGRLQKLLRSGQVRVDGKRVTANARLSQGAQIRIPAAARVPVARRPSLNPPPGLSKADRTFIESLIIYEDDHVLVLNKPFGLAVQGGSGTRRHIDGLLEGMADRFGGRPRLVHRLDRDTTGVLLVAKSRQVAATLGRTFQTRSAKKTYWALVNGVPKPPQGRIEAALVKDAGKDGDRVRKAQAGEQDKAQHATTHYAVIDRAGQAGAWVSLKPVTGRQHQLRAHMHLIECPIVGDNKYFGDKTTFAENLTAKLHLHARRLMLPHPVTREPLDVIAPLSDHMLVSWQTLGFDPTRYDAEAHDATANEPTTTKPNARNSKLKSAKTTRAKAISAPTTRAKTTRGPTTRSKTRGANKSGATADAKSDRRAKRSDGPKRTRRAGATKSRTSKR